MRSLRFFILLFAASSLLFHPPSDFEAFAATSDATIDSTKEINETTTSLGLVDSDNFGVSVANIGDLDGDGVNDLAVGAWLDDMEEAKDIAIVLRAGKLPAPIKKVYGHEVGPALGQDSVDKGTKAILVGLVLVLVFMLIYYKFAGLIADIALIWNLVLVLAVLAMLDATLTLPGIAGLILTVGMSVDANVIIFERIREEMRKGKTVRAAIDSGYTRALTTIIDANVTTLLVALILWQFGTGPIKGFAVVLFAGIAISMFTAIFFTRTIFNIITSRKQLKTLSI